MVWLSGKENENKIFFKEKFLKVAYGKKDAILETKVIFSYILFSERMWIYRKKWINFRRSQSL